MRSALLFLLAMGVFIAAYFMVAWIMPDPQVASRRPNTQVVPTVPKQAERVIGDIDGVTLRSHDPRTGAPIAEIRIGEYRRSGENQVLLREIEATILMDQDAGVVTLVAPTGTVDLEAEAEQEDRLTAETLGTADVARLSDVIVRWYETPAAAAKGPSAALLTLRVNNLVYDNKRFSVFTDDTVIDGATVLADDVPVEVRGRDYDFDGRGLLVRWDAQTRRPTLFRVARGERLTIKTDQAFVPTQIVSAEQTMSAPHSAGAMLAALGDQAVSDALAAKAQGVPAYRATLSQNLRAEQGGLTILEADRAQALLGLGVAPVEEKPAPTAETPPPSTQPGEAPATQPADAQEPFVPVTVRWEGELLIEAVDGAAEPLALETPEDIRLHLTGSPLVMRQEDMEARGLELRYSKSSDELEFTGDEDTPVTLVDGEGNTLVTSQLLAHPYAGTATARSAGYAEVAAGKGEAMQLRWHRECDFAFETSEQGEEKDRPNQLKSVLARGGVTVRHPDVWLDSDALDVQLASAGKEASELRSVKAAGAVRTVLKAEQEDETTLSSDRLLLDLPDGMDGAVKVVAEGKVQSEQEGQQLASKRLEVTLTPDDHEDLQLSELLATGEVLGLDEEGRVIRADAMRATPIAPAAVPAPDGEAAEEQERAVLVQLQGTAERPAVVEMAKDRLAAPVLEFNSAEKTVHVPGAGEMQTLQQGEDGQPWPLSVGWTGSMNGRQEEVVIEGEVHLLGRREVGGPEQPATLMEFQSDQATLHMAPPPPADAEEPATRPAELAGQVEQLSLRGALSGTVEERLQDTLLRSFDLRAESLDAWPVGESARLLIESDGRILFRDLRLPPPAESEPAGRAAVAAGEADAAPTADTFRGSAAIAWKQRLSYEPETGVLLLEGGVTVAVEPAEAPGAADAKEGRAFWLEADQLRVQTEQVQEQVGQEQKKRTEIRGVAATGSARFRTEGVSFEAGEVLFDPATQRVTARGAAGVPVVVFDAAGVPTGRFAELIYNVKTSQIEHLRDLNAGG